MNRRRMILGCAVLALAGCSLTRPHPESTTYAIEPGPGTASAVRRPETLRIGSVRVAPSFAGQELVYRLDDVRFASDFYNKLIAPPGTMLGTRMGQWLDRWGPFRVATQPGAAAPATYVLDAVFTDLYGDFRPGQKPAAVMSVQFYLLDVSSSGSKTLLARSLGRRIELSQASGAELVRGYGIALTEILTEMSADMAKPGGF